MTNRTRNIIVVKVTLVAACLFALPVAGASEAGLACHIEFLR